MSVRKYNVVPVSLSFVHDKIDGTAFSDTAFKAIVRDINQGRYSLQQIACFLTASAAHKLSDQETLSLTKAMTHAGPSLSWDSAPTLDKHCIGGLPGNRTTPIVVAILAALGFRVPKTSSRAITSAAGTADVMEVLAPVHLTIDEMSKVIRQARACIVWGGAVGLSPVDDDLIRVARDINLDGEGQMVASILSKKLAAGSTHVVIDIPIGPTAKVHSHEAAITLKAAMERVANTLGIKISVLITDGCQPIGFGIGPALEARDVVAVLKNDDAAPTALREKSIHLAGAALELATYSKKGEGQKIARECLLSGKAWTAFLKICEAQGGLRPIPKAKITHIICARKGGTLQSVNNTRLSRIAKIAGAPEHKAAGLELFHRIGAIIKSGDPLFSIHAMEACQLTRAVEEAQGDCPYKILVDDN